MTIRIENLSEEAGFSPRRRAFLQTGVLLGGGLVLGVGLGGYASDGIAATAATLNAYVRIGSDNTVTLVVPQAEMGQGVATALPMILADELDADWKRVRIEFAPLDPAYTHPMFGLQLTGGSSAIRAFLMPLREAGAAAREMLVAAAAQQWNVAPAACRTENGTVRAGNRRVSYGELAAAAARLAPPAEPKLKRPEQLKLIGKGAKRLDSRSKIDGSARFGIDVKLPGLLTAVVAHPPVVGGKLTSFNADQAKVVQGVRQVVAIQSGVAVVADNYYAAKKGRDALAIQWEDGPLAALSSEAIFKTFAEKAQEPGLAARREGDPESAQAAKTLEAVYQAPYLAHACMEPMNCTAWVKPDGVEIWAGTQSPSICAMVAQQLVGVTPDKVKVHTQYLGGGFGRRFAADFLAEALQLSKAVDAPVKVVYPREDDIRGQFYRPASYTRFTAGLDAQGNPVSYTAKVVCPSVAAIAFPALMTKEGLDPTAVEGIAELPYAVPHIRVDWVRHDPGVGVWFWRSVGHSQNAFFSESFIDELAHAAGRDPFEFRRGLLDKRPRHKRVLELAAEKAGWGKPLPAGRARGIAVAESFGSYVAQVAEVSVGADGAVRVHRVVCAVDCGMVVNPDTIRAQMQSGIIWGLSAALYGKITLKDGRIEQSNFHDYPVVRMHEAPAIEVHIVPDAEGVGGVGEVGVPPLAPAVANAIYALTKRRIRTLPIADQLKQA